jgi:3-dehydroquinate synthase class II
VQVLVEAVTSDGEVHSHLLQNAETVRLVGPGGGGAAPAWRAVSVSELAEGDELWVLRQGAARHTGVSIEESIVER